MSERKIHRLAAAAWLGDAGLQLDPEEAIAFLEAASTLLPRELDPLASAIASASPTEAQRAALAALWLWTGAPPAAPHPMPLHPLSPGVVGASWRWLREALSRAPRAEAE